MEYKENAPKLQFKDTIYNQSNSNNNENDELELLLQSLKQHLMNCNPTKKSLFFTALLSKLMLSKIPQVIILVLERVLMTLDSEEKNGNGNGNKNDKFSLYILSMPLLKAINNLSIHALAISSSIPISLNSFSHLNSSCSVDSLSFDRIINWQLLQLLSKGRIDGIQDENNEMQKEELITFESVVETLAILLQYQHYSLLSMEYKLALEFLFKIYDPSQISTIYLLIYIERFLNSPLRSNSNAINAAFSNNINTDSMIENNDSELERMAQEIAMITTMLLDNQSNSNNNFVKACRILYEQFRLMADYQEPLDLSNLNSSFVTNSQSNGNDGNDGNAKSNENDGNDETVSFTHESNNQNEIAKKREKFILLLLLWNRINEKIRELTSGSINLFSQLKFGNHLFRWIEIIEDYLFSNSSSSSSSLSSSLSLSHQNEKSIEKNENSNKNNENSLSLFQILILLQGMQSFIQEAFSNDHEMWIKYSNMLSLRLLERFERLMVKIKNENHVEDYHDQLNKLSIIKLFWMIFYYNSFQSPSSLVQSPSTSLSSLPSSSSSSFLSFENRESREKIEREMKRKFEIEKEIEAKKSSNECYCPLSRFYWEILEIQAEKNANLTLEQFENWNLLERAILETKWDLIKILRIHSLRDIMNRLEQKEQEQEQEQIQRDRIINKTQVMTEMEMRELPSIGTLFPLSTQEQVVILVQLKEMISSGIIIPSLIITREMFQRDFIGKCIKEIQRKQDKFIILWIDIIIQTEFLINFPLDIQELINRHLIPIEKNENENETRIKTDFNKDGNENRDKDNISQFIPNYASEKLCNFWKNANNDIRINESRMLMIETLVNLLIYKSQDEFEEKTKKLLIQELNQIISIL